MKYQLQIVADGKIFKDTMLFKEEDKEFALNEVTRLNQLKGIRAELKPVYHDYWFEEHKIKDNT